MSQNLKMQSSQFSKTSGLKPPLAAALASLEVQLDRELARYRRTRSGGYRAGSQASKSPSVGMLPNSPVSTTNSENINVQSDESEIALPENANQPLIYTSEVTTTPPPPPPPPPPSPKVTVTAFAEVPDETAPPSSASIVPITKVKTEASEETRTESIKDEPNDYLESSEALLRSLTEETTSQKRANRTNDSLLSPLGIGSILLLLVASVILGYVVINPRSLPQFSLDGLFKRNNSIATNGDSTINESSSGAKTVAQPQLTPIPRYPNLAKDEFPEVNSPNDVVGLKPKSKPTPTLTVAPTPIAPVQNPVIVPPVASSVPVTPPVATTSVPLPSPTPTAEVPLADLKPSSDGFYHVVVDNTGQNDFANARKTVPDAYLSPDGKLIYLGAIKNKQKAQELLTEIKGKGLNARIRQP